MLLTSVNKVMKNSLNKAIIIAAKIHKGKKGRNREPAIMHPIRAVSYTHLTLPTSDLV